LLIPLSYFAIFGGTCTLIGTSTNLVVDGLMQQHGLRGIGLFEIGAVGIPYALVGYVYILTIGKNLLPDRKELLEQLEETRRDYLLEMLVRPECRLIGLTVQEAGLRSLPALFLIEIERGSELFGPVAPDEVVLAGDRLVFTGVVSSIIELEKIPGLVPAVDPTYDVATSAARGRRMCEAVVSVSSPLVGRSIRDADFRATYGAAVVAVHRGGSRVEKKVGDIKLRPGDTLLLQTGSHFVRAHRNNPAFYLVSAISDWRPLRRDRAWIASLIFLALIVLMSVQFVSTAVISIVAAVSMVAMGCISSGDARRSIEWQVLITIASAFAIGSALENTGVATAFAEVLLGYTTVWGPLAALATVYFLVSLFTELITNNAAAVLMFPICLEIARVGNLDSRPFMMTLVLAASASFLTPIGYQTNMMIYGPGGYRFSDFLKVGAPLKLLFFGVTLVLVPIIWPF
jgi:di/tricarboxylate transporter